MRCVAKGIHDRSASSVQTARRPTIVPICRKTFSSARRRIDHGRKLNFDCLLIATGADSVKLNTPTSGDARLFYLRSFDDSRALLAAAATAKRVVVVGASFIGLEVAAALRQRGIDVHVVGPEHIPFERVLGPQVGAFVRDLHTKHTVSCST